MRFSLCLAASLLCLSAFASADTPTDTPTDSPTATITLTATVTPTSTASPTPTPGPGVWNVIVPQTLVYGVPGNTAIWTYTTSEPWTLGKLIFVFPPTLEGPTSSNFFLQPSQVGHLGPTPYVYPSPGGVTVEVQVGNLNPGDTLSFLYGYDSTGFTVTDTASPLAPFALYASPDSLTLTPAAVTPFPPPPPINVITATNTPTVTPTGTITVTATVTPTITATFTITQTFTETPVAPAPTDGLLCYPNPFDLRLTDKVTIRFQPLSQPQISVQIFNLMGEPVRTLDPQDIFPAYGWALWHGEDDYLRRMPGGIYFVRVKTPDKTMVKRITVLR
jgi:hypothetical protein